MLFTGIEAKCPRFVTHKGIVICKGYAETILNPTSSLLGYSVLQPEQASQSSDNRWSDFEILKFLEEIRPVGMQVITLKAAGLNPAAADVPFQFISDSEYIYLFRQSTAGTLLVDRYVFDEVLMKLDFVWEVRFRRSRKVDLPADRKDTFGTTSMDSDRFVQPTTELGMIGNLENGGFSVQILHTDVASVERWMILAWNASTKAIDNWSILRAANGMFDLSDSIDPHSKLVRPANSFNAPTGLAFSGGPDSLVYQRQEWLDAGNGVKRLFARSARVMIAIPTTPGDRTAILDFATGKSGRIADVSGALPIASVPAPGTARHRVLVPTFSAVCRRRFRPTVRRGCWAARRVLRRCRCSRGPERTAAGALRHHRLRSPLPKVPRYLCSMRRPCRVT